MKPNKLVSVLSIAGTDPSGGAGINADIKAISATGAYAASVVTALVAQNTQGVQSILEIPADFVQAQLNAVFSDLDIQAVKIGMLHDERIIRVIAETLLREKPLHVVFDPVMVAKDGTFLLDLDTLSLLKEKLLGLTHLITPNLVEAEHLLGQSIQTAEAMQAAAITLGQAYQINVLVKGGHLSTSESADVLYELNTNACHWFHASRIQTRNTHGTGCSLSAAIASYLAQGWSLTEAIETAKDYLTHAIDAGKNYSLGKGNGPVDHFYFLENRRLFN